jgi:hypothetical protein
MIDVAAWLGLPLEIIHNERYANTFEVYDSTGFFKNQYGAKCTTELKKLPRRQYERLGSDIQVFGYDVTERDRAARFVANNPEVDAVFPLIDAGLTKAECRHILAKRGIAEPVTYAMGFNNANCLAAGCVKGGIGYWNHIRRVFPDVFERMAQKERQLGYALLAQNGKPVFLDELHPDAGNHKAEPAIQCGLFCGEY